MSAPTTTADSGAVNYVGSFAITTKKIGYGSFAKVFLGYHATEKYEVAVKVVDIHHNPRPYAEVKELMKLHKPSAEGADGATDGVDGGSSFSSPTGSTSSSSGTGAAPYTVRLYDQQKNDKYLCLFLEYCRGGDLQKALERRHRSLHSSPSSASVPSLFLDEFTVRRLSRQMTEALLFFSRKQVMHRDLKPANILLTDKNLSVADVRVADFGFARGTEKDLLVSKTGTAYYMAPERLSGDEYNFGAEVWAAGLIFYEMMFGRHPFPSRTDVELSKKAALSSAATLFDATTMPEVTLTTQEFRDLIVRMLDPNPSTRIGIEEVAVHPWFTISLSSSPKEMRSVGVDAGTFASDQRDNATTTVVRKLSDTTAAAPPSQRHHDPQPQPTTFSVALLHDEPLTDHSGGRPELPSARAPPAGSSSVGSASTPTVETKRGSEDVSSAAASSTNPVPPTYSIPPPVVANTSILSGVGSDANESFVHSISGRGAGGSLQGSPSLGPNCSGLAVPPLSWAPDVPAPHHHPLNNSSFSTTRTLSPLPNLYGRSQHPHVTMPLLELAKVVRWAAEEALQTSHRITLYTYAALVATGFEISAPCAQEIALFRDECLEESTRYCHLLSATHAAAEERQSPTPQVLVMQTILLWIRIVVDPVTEGKLNAVELERVYAGIGSLCEILVEDPAVLPPMSEDAKSLKQLAADRWEAHHINQQSQHVAQYHATVSSHYPLHHQQQQQHATGVLKYGHHPTSHTGSSYAPLSSGGSSYRQTFGAR